MSASVSVDSFGSDEPTGSGVLDAGTKAIAMDNIAVDDLAAADLAADNIAVDAISVDDISVIEIEVIEDPLPQSASVDRQTIVDEPPSGFQDPIMPVVILGILSLIVIVALAAFLAL